MPTDIKKNIKDTQELEISVFSKYKECDLDFIIVIIIIKWDKNSICENMAKSSWMS